MSLAPICRPIITKSLNWSKTLIVSMVILFGISIFIFNRMGGEFIPNLEEGDFTAEISMAPGTSLSQMIKSCSLSEKILKEQFPEVKQAVTRIGSSNIPTDPMPIERADMMIALIPKKEWTLAKTKEELMEKMVKIFGWLVVPKLQQHYSKPI